MTKVFYYGYISGCLHPVHFEIKKEHLDKNNNFKYNPELGNIYYLFIDGTISEN